MMFKIISQAIQPLYESGDVQVLHRSDTGHGDLKQIMDNLRGDDLFELACMNHTPDDALRLTLHASHTYVVRKGERPVFVGGVHQVFPHCFLVFGFGTEETPHVIRPVTRYIRNHWLPTMFQEGATRFEVRVPACSPSVRWLEALGFRKETVLAGYAANGEPHLQLAITRPFHVHISRTEAHGREGRGRAGCHQGIPGEPGES